MINWGIIGAGNIAHRFAKSLESVEGARLYAVARRTLAKAEAFKAMHPCDVAYGDYQALLDDQAVDAVYIALPHLLHYEWIEKAILAGKAVLCEKPATMNVEEMTRVKALADKHQVFFMEAMKSRFTPAYQAAKASVLAGDIGEIEGITTSLCRVFLEEEATYHYEADQGGCLLDMGIYNAAFIEDFIDGPLQINEVDSIETEDDVEIYINAIFYSDEKEYVLESAFDRETETVAVISGSKGILRVPDFHRPQRYELITEGSTQVFDIPYIVDDFYGEIQHVVNLLEAGKLESPIMPMQASINAIAIIEQIKTLIRL
ncbi:Gfo/Idh/MocA family protein [Fundicoccus culcitae]|uniref:Gfo/Idh/MocA family oxidoreductase n=1 Tax=Fundicoccus culcitae TaxID=2969821 RepID=A0ABY5P7T1_9LACT|nr:Gfo/Idh/MocA family oxidoreductase [Fundicoccus culcitae]UUX34794.1 Gfo/Idh/MocA family oxidoreductase [Fundicoccus culcitae]